MRLPAIPLAFPGVSSESVDSWDSDRPPSVPPLGLWNQLQEFGKGTFFGVHSCQPTPWLFLCHSDPHILLNTTQLRKTSLFWMLSVHMSSQGINEYFSLWVRMHMNVAFFIHVHDIVIQIGMSLVELLQKMYQSFRAYNCIIRWYPNWYSHASFHVVGSSCFK